MSNSTFTSRTTSAEISTTPFVPSTTPSVPASSTTPSVAATTPSSSASLTPSTITSSVSISPTSTVIVAPSTTTPSVVVTSSLVIISSSGPTVVTITSTQAPVTITPSVSGPAVSTSASPAPTILSSEASNGGSAGLGTSGKIAIAVVIPIVVIALLFLLGIFLWRKRKARNAAEEQRKDEMAEYGFNPNNDPSLVPVGGAYTDGGSDADDGYRGWGTTSSNPRKASTTIGSNGKGPVMTYSDTTSQPGNYGYQNSPPGQATEHWSGDPLMGNHHEGIDGVAALGGAAAGGTAGAMARNNRVSAIGVQRGPSNASSSYSHGAPRSEASSDTPGAIASYYQEEVPYNIYNDVAPSHGPYGDGAYHGPGPEQPVIRDVQARRNTRIERVPTFPQTQGGIAQNF